jgi:hypothetical protein
MGRTNTPTAAAKIRSEMAIATPIVVDTARSRPRTSGVDANAGWSRFIIFILPIKLQKTSDLVETPIFGVTDLLPE